MWIYFLYNIIFLYVFQKKILKITLGYWINLLAKTKLCNILMKCLKS